MRRVLSFVIASMSFALAFGLTVSPARAVGTYNGTSGTVECIRNGLPDGYFTIANNEVTGSSACRGAATIPANVTTIGVSAFDGSAVSVVTFAPGSSLTRIDNSAFYEAYSLSSINLPSGLTTIGEYAFADTPALASITLPSGLTAINEGTFAYNAFSSITIPASVTTIGVSAFYDGDLTSLTFEPGSSLLTIGNQAFWGQNLLASITIPASVTTIEPTAFRNTTALSSLVIEPGITPLTIGNSAFAGATSLTSLIIPSRVTVIGVNAFEGTTSLTDLSFAAASNLTTISELAFYGSAFDSVTIPKSVETIKFKAFMNVDLSNLTFEPESQLTTIEGEAFRGTDIVSTSIPASVSSIEDMAFYDTALLSSVYFLGNEPSMGMDVFTATRASDPTAYIAAAASGFVSTGNPARWNGFIVSAGVYTASFNSNGGSNVTPRNFRSSIENAPTPPTRTGYTFAGWSATDGGSEIAFPYNPGVSADITLFAKWTLNPVSPPVSAPSGNNASGSTPTSSVTQSSQAAAKSIQFSARTRTLSKANKVALKRSVMNFGVNATYVVTGSAGKRPGIADLQVRNLAKLRASAIRAYLVSLGVKESNIKIKLKITNQGIVPKTKLLAKNLTS